MEQLVTKDDMLLSSFKYNRRSNFKHGLINSLGVFEDQDFFDILQFIQKDLSFWFASAHVSGFSQKAG
jgi:hypothetical protein